MTITYSSEHGGMSVLTTFQLLEMSRLRPITVANTVEVESKIEQLMSEPANSSSFVNIASNAKRS